jgi:hypothetical protein
VGKSGPFSAISAKIPATQPAAAAADVGKSGPFSAVSAKIPAAQLAAAKPGAAAEAGKSGPTAVTAPNQVAAAKTADLAEPPHPSAPPPSPPRLPEPKPEVAVAQPAAATALKPTVAPEPIPEPVNSGRLGEPIVAKKELDKRAAAAAPVATPAAAPPESAGSPVPRLGPPPRVATALDGGGSSPISIEAARELIGLVEEDRDAIFEALCRGARSRCAFAAVLTLHGEVAFGRVALLEEWLDRAQLGRIAVQLDRASPFRTVAKERSTFLGTIGAEAVAGDPLRALQRSVPTAAAVLPVLVRGRAVALLYLDDDGRELPSTVLEELKPLLADVSQAFLRIAQKSKAGGLGAEPELGAVGEELPATGTSAWRAPSGKSPRQSAPVDSQSTPLPPAVPAAVSPVPQPAPEQPTVPLRVPPPTAAPSQPKAAPAAAEPPRPAVPEHIHTQPTVPVAAAKAAAPAATAAKASPPAGKSDKRAGKPVEAPAAPAAPASPAAAARDASAQTLAELIERAGNLDETAIDQLLAGGSDAARAVVAALPGPLRSRERQALGDPVGGPVYSRGPLLALALRMGQAAIEPMLARLADPSTPSEARYYLTLCFAEAPVAAAIAPLGSCLEDSDDTVRMAAVSALRSFPPSSELSSLISKLRDAVDAADAKRARFAVEALGELRVATAVPQLINLLDHEDPALVDAVGRALQTITKQDFGRSRSRWTAWWRRRQDEPRLQWLLEGLTHPSAMLRSAAQDELTGLSGDVVGYRFDQPRRDREQARKRWAQWWQRRGYPVL